MIIITNASYESIPQILYLHVLEKLGAAVGCVPARAFAGRTDRQVESMACFYHMGDSITRS